MIANEAARLKALHAYHILDTDPEQAFDDLTLLASQVCGTPIALITLVDEKRQWFKSRVGIDVTETERSISFCAHAIEQPGLFEVPDTLSEYQFAGLLRGRRVELVDCRTIPLKVPAEAEIVIEGHVSLDEQGDEGPYGDHTGYYNSVEKFPVFTISAITMRRKPIYLSTFTGRPPDEPSVLGEALNEVFIPLFQQQFPEVVDFWLPPEGCSYRIAVVSMKMAYAGHAKRVMFGVWSFLRQFMYTKFIVVVDDDVDIRDWKEVIWAITTRVDPIRDTTLVDNTPIDYLDFASPVSGLGSKMGIDATNKWPAETSRAWGRVISRDAALAQRVDALCAGLGF